MCPRSQILEKQIEELSQLVARGFGQLAKSKDPTVQCAAEQVTQTLRAQKRRAASPKSNF